MYSDKLMDHFTEPRNTGEIEDADGVGRVSNAICGDIIKVYIDVEEERIKDIKFKTLGCAAAIATSSMMTEMVKDRPLSEAQMITDEQVAEALDGLPEEKMHCSNLAAEGLRSAIEDYRKNGDK